MRNRQRYLDNAGSRRRVVAAERMSYLLDFFATHHCVDCGEGDASVLEFDHLGDKSFTISHGFRDRPWHEVLAEIEKCEVRCANCHKRRTAESQGWFRARLFEDGFNRAIDPRV